MKTALRKFAWLTLLTLTAGLHHVRAQTIIFSEGFERGFPGAWSVGDDHSGGSPAYWLDVDADFGGEGTHAGSRKGYCAGIGHAGDNANPTYQNDMSAYLSRTIDLSSHSSATLTFWHKIPSIESGYDQARVILSGIDPIELWSASTPTAAWTLVTLDLTPYVGNSRTLTFRFDSDSSATAEGWYLDDIRVSGIAPPPNDDCQHALELAAGLPHTVDTSGATSDSFVPSCQVNFGKGVWFTFTPAASGMVEVSTCGSGFDTVLQIYAGADCRTMAEVPDGCNDDNGPACASPQASVRFPGIANTPYRILAGGYGAEGGMLTIVASLVEAELLVDKSAAPDPVELGQPLAYTVTVTNLGPQAATGVTMIDRLPGSMTFGAVLASQGTCTNEWVTDSGAPYVRVTCWLGTLPAHTSATVAITVTPTVIGTLTNAALAYGLEPDPNTANNVALASVRVVEAMPPTIVCPANLVATTDPGQCSRSNVTFVVTATDDSPGVTVVCTPPSGSTFAKGVTTVTCVATDASGNASSCDFTVTIEDAEAPRIDCPSLVTAETCDLGTSVEFTVTTSDNCDLRPPAVCAPPSGSVFPLGDTPVDCVVTDSSGNSTQCGFIVRVMPQVSPPFGLSTGMLGRHPDLAYSSAHDTWLAVWNEGSPPYPGAGRPYARLVDSGGQTLTTPTALGGLGTAASAPRVAYDPVSDEFLVVWTSGGDPMETMGESESRLHARRVSGTGMPVGDGPVVVTGADGVHETNPDVAAGQVRVSGGPWQPYWMLVWEDHRTGNRRIHAQAGSADDSTLSGSLRLSDFPLVVDAAVGLPNHQSFRPRLSDAAPLQVGVGPDPTDLTIHSLVFEVHEGSGPSLLTEIYGAQLTHRAVRGTLNLTRTSAWLENEFEPAIVWNRGNNRSLFTFRRGSEIRGQLLQPLNSAPWFEALAPDILIEAGDQAAFVALPTDGGFAGMTHLAVGNQGLRLTGLRVLSLFGYHADTDQPALALNDQSPSSLLLAWRSGGFGGSQAVIGRLLCGLFPLANQPPTASAGADGEVYAGTPFMLDGSGSSDSDGDPLVYRWQADPPAAVLGGSNQAALAVEAPLLGAGITSTTLVFQLDVDDLRSAARWPAQDSVAIRVVPGVDPHPPVADAGPDRTEDEDVWVQLDGSASHDPDHEPLAFAWQFVGYSPPTNLPAPGFLPNALASQPRFRTPRFSRIGGLDLVLRMRVSSASGGWDEQTVTIRVNDSVNEDPVAIAGADRTETEHVQFMLYGGASYDPNGDPLAHEWQVISTPHTRGGFSEEFKIFNATTVTPTIEASVFEDRDLELQLTVRDGRGGEGRDRILIHVLAQPLQVTSVHPMHGSPGTIVTLAGHNLSSITAVNFNGYGGSLHPESDQIVQVIVPNGPRVRRAAGAFLSDYHAGLFDVWEHPSVTTGPLVVTDGQTSWAAPQPFQVAHVELRNVLLTQGLKHNALVLRKDSLLQVQVRTREASGSNALASAARCLVFTNTPLTPPMAFSLEATNPALQILPRGAVPTEMNHAFNFFLDGQLLTAPKCGFSIEITHNGVETLYLESLFPTDEFVETVSPRILVIPIVPMLGNQVAPTFNATRFWANYAKAQETFERIYPVGGAEFVVHPSYFSLPSMMDDDGLIELEAFGLTGNFLADVLPGVVQLHGILEKWNQTHPNQRALFVVGAIDQDLHDAETTTGFGVPPRDMMARMVKYSITEDLPVLGPILEAINEILEKILCFFCLFLCDCPDPIEEAVKGFFGILDSFGAKIEGDTAFVALRDGFDSTLAHELGHNLGFVDPYAFNSDPENLSHSRYDEGMNHDSQEPPPTPVPGLRFIDAPYALPPAYNVQPPGAMWWDAEAKSLMSYVAGRTKDNTFHEPLDYEHLRSRFRKPVGALPRSIGPANAASDPKLQLLGWMNLTNGQATVAQSKLLPPATLESRTEGDSALALVFLDATGVVLREVFVPFTFLFHTSPTQPIRELPVIYSPFEIVQAMPEGTARAELRWLGATAWSRTVSAHPPVVQVLAPTAEAYLPANTGFMVRWSALDPDGDAMTYDVSYSPDGGITYVPLTSMVTNNEFLWLTHLAPDSTEGFLKVEASDGFHVGSAIAGPFVVDPKPPLVSITSPIAGARLVQSAGVFLAGQAYDFGQGAILNDAAYQWSSSRDGSLGPGRKFEARDLSAGAHDLLLTVTHGLFEASSVVPVLVLADSDGDGIPDETEAATPGLDPHDPADMFTDEDGDGIVRATELLRLGTDPLQADSDGDGLSDGVELTQGLAPQTADLDGDGVPDGQDDCPLVFNPDQADGDNDGVGNACDWPTDALRITSVRLEAGAPLRIGFQPAPDALAYQHVLEAAATVYGPWEILPDAAVLRAEPPEHFRFVTDLPPDAAIRFFRVRQVQ